MDTRDQLFGIHKAWRGQKQVLNLSALCFIFFWWRKTYWQEEASLPSVAVVRTAHTLVRKPLGCPSWSWPPQPGQGQEKMVIFLFVSSPDGFKRVHVSALQWGLLVNSLAPSQFWLVLIPVLHSYGCHGCPSAACGYGSWFRLWCCGGTLWIFHLDCQQLSLPLLLPKTDPGTSLAGSNRWSILAAITLQSWRDAAGGGRKSAAAICFPSLPLQ